MDLENLCRTCLLEIKREPVRLSEQLYEFLEKEMQFSDVPRSHPQVNLPQSICFKCYCTFISCKRFYIQCKHASKYLTSQIEYILSESSLPENDNKLNHDVECDYTITIEEADDMLAEQCDEVDVEFLQDLDNDDHSRVTMYEESKCIEYELENNDENVTNVENLDSYILPNMISDLDKEFLDNATEAENGHSELARRPDVTRLFVCKLCGKEFNGKYDLAKHETSHPGVRPFACEVCGAAFKQRSALNTHLSLHYGKTVPCPLCDKKFARKSFLKLHIRSHRDERPYQCEQCGKTFRTMHLLAGHEQAHTGQMQYVCKFCTKSFYCRRSLIAHINHTHATFYCNHCECYFKQRSKLYEHLSKTHNIEKSTDSDFTKKLENNEKQKENKMTNIRISKKSKSDLLMKMDDEN